MKPCEPDRDDPQLEQRVHDPDVAGVVCRVGDVASERQDQADEQRQPDGIPRRHVRDG